MIAWMFICKNWFHCAFKRQSLAFQSATNPPSKVVTTIHCCYI